VRICFSSGAGSASAADAMIALPSKAPGIVAAEAAAEAAAAGTDASHGTGKGKGKKGKGAKRAYAVAIKPGLLAMHPPPPMMKQAVLPPPPPPPARHLVQCPLPPVPLKRSHSPVVKAEQLERKMQNRPTTPPRVKNTYGPPQALCF
jgi:hypothetical protein